jgi:hypothetical protein
MTLTAGKGLHPSECLIIPYTLASSRRTAIGIYFCMCSKYFFFPPYTGVFINVVIM